MGNRNPGFKDPQSHGEMASGSKLNMAFLYFLPYVGISFFCFFKMYSSVELPCVFDDFSKYSVELWQIMTKVR